MQFGQKARRYAQVVTCVGLAGMPSAALARSAALPGITVGLPTGWQLPEGVQVNVTSSFAERSTSPRANQGQNNLAVFLWATPWKVLGGQLRFLQSFPYNFQSPQLGPWQSGLFQPLTTAQIAWKIGDNVGVSYFLGGFWPSDTLLALRSASIAQRFAISYVADGWNLTANLHYGTMLAENSPTNVHYSDYLNLDLTATKRIGKWQFGAVAFGSTDLPTNRPGYRPVGQFAMGPLVGYAFEKFTLQTFVTRDIAQRNLNGEETRGWVRLILPLWRPEKKADQVPNRVTVRSNEAAGPTVSEKIRRAQR
ncbi:MULTISPECIES: transporter [unclassified Methylobacterium]|uniref:transporter n=1 Tax=unclassified Methylobacterium TaxID=2615210 RepID=UPI0037034170